MTLMMSHSQSHQEVEKLLGEETQKLSPPVKDIIAKALHKVRQQSQKQSGSV
jgi:hypothetical protein